MSNLEQQIEWHRLAYKDDPASVSRLVSRQPPTTLDPNTGELHVEPGAATGMPMSGRLLRYLGHPEGYGGDFPWSKALWLLRVECRRRHQFHKGTPDQAYWQGSLCHQFVVFVVIRGWSVQNAARILRYDDPEKVLRFAFGFIEDQMDEFRRKAERRAREDEGKFTIYDKPPEHHAVDGLHRAECPQCRRKEDAA